MTTKITPKSISQHKLRAYLDAKKASEDLAVLKAEIIIMADEGLPCQPGPLSCSVKSKKGSRRPAWKDHAMALAIRFKMDAEKWAQKIINATLPSAPSKSLEIVDRDNPTG